MENSVLITGNRGYIGSGLDGDGIDIKDGVDIRNYKAKEKYDVVIHTAALTNVVDSVKNPQEYYSVNVLGTLNMLREHPEAHFIYLSTCAVYGEGMHTFESLLNPKSPYAETKLKGELLVQALAKSWAILRLTNVIAGGERGEPNVYHIFEKEPIIPIYGDGLQTRNFIHVDKVRQVIMQAVHRHGIINVGSEKSTTILDLAKEFNKPIRFLPEREGEIKHFGVLDAVDNLI